MQPNDTARKRAPRRPRVERTCETCGATFSTWQYAIDRGAGRFCGQACFAQHRLTGEQRRCEQCDAPFYAKPDKIRRNAGRFCNVACYDTHQREAHPVEERLWLRVDKHGAIPPHRSEYGECWLWIGKINRAGYGRIYRHFPDAEITHRLAWEIATGETLTSDDVIGHICDVRRCLRNDEEGTYTVNGIVLPRRGHLFKGTQEDNRADMVQKGRNRYVLASYIKHGEDNHLSKLTEANVRQIRSLYAAGGISQTALGQRFGIDQTVVSKIVLRKSWKHLD